MFASIIHYFKAILVRKGLEKSFDVYMSNIALNRIN